MTVYILFKLCHIAYWNLKKKSFFVFSGVNDYLSFLFVCLGFCEPITYSKYSDIIISSQYIKSILIFLSVCISLGSIPLGASILQLHSRWAVLWFTLLFWRLSGWRHLCGAWGMRGESPREFLYLFLRGSHSFLFLGSHPLERDSWDFFFLLCLKNVFILNTYLLIV